jgi:uncharacterized protein (TIGR01777 family)
MADRRVAITGATGLIGGALGAHLREQGWTVQGISRSGDEAIRWDPAAGELDGAALEGVDAVVHLAGENVAGRWSEAKKKRILQSRVQGTTLIARTLAGLRQPPSVLVSASATGYYGDRGDARLTEDEPAGEGFLAEVCVAWEASAAPAAEAGIRVVHPRIGVVLAREGGALAAMKTPFKMGVGGKIGGGEQLMPWVHLDDVVRMIAFALEHRELSGPFNAVAPAPVSNAVFTKALGKALSRPTFMPLPGGLAKLAMGEAADEMLLFSTGAVPTVLQGLGFEWRYPELREALAAALG